MDTQLPLTLDAEGDAGARARTRSPSLRIYLSAVVGVVIASLVADTVANDGIRTQLRSGAPWVLALFFVEMFPIPVWRDIRISFGYPLIMFLAVLYEPSTVGLFVLLGSGDPREFTGESDLLRSLFNRSQVAAAAYLASALFHTLTPAPMLGPAVLGVAVLASAAEVVVNMLLVSVAARLDYGVPLSGIIRKLPVGNAWLFEPAYVGLGVLGVVVALLYLEVGVWAVVGLILPLVSIRHLVKVWGTLEHTRLELEREGARRRVGEQLAAERVRERRRLASILHDELGPLLASAGGHLEAALKVIGPTDGQVAEQVSAALTADRAAQRNVRVVIGELLQSPSGPNGLRDALDRLFTEVAATHRVVVRHGCEPIQAPHTLNELLFTIAREATRNAIDHGDASSLEVTLREVDGKAVLSVIDDGRGFDPERLADEEDHFGLRLLREQTETYGGRFSVSSAPGEGTSVTAEIPLPGPDGSAP